MTVIQYYKKHHLIINCLLFVLILAIIGVFNYIPYNPNGIHLARQSDGYSFILHYANNGLNLFEPGNLNVESNDGKCVSELPILYYLEAIIFKGSGLLFGVPELICLIFLVIAFGACNALFFDYLQDYLLSFFSTVLLFSSTVLLYYGHRNMPDAPGLAFLFLGLRHYYKFIKYQDRGLVTSVVLLTFATLFKPALFFFQGGLILYSLFLNKTYNIRRIFAYQSIGVIVVLLWVVLINHYNKVNHVFYYTTQIRPFWTYDLTRTLRAIDIMWHYWYSKYYFQSTLHLFASFLLIVFFSPLVNRKQRFVAFLAIGSSLVYFALFTEQFIDHDYYFIPFIPTLGIITAIAIKALLEWKKQVVSVIVSVIVIIISLLSMDYASLNLKRRFTQNLDLHTAIRYKALQIKSKVDALDPSGKKEVIVYGEHSRNISLVFLKRRGWMYKPDYQMDKGWVKSAIKIDLNNFTVIPGE